MLRMLYLVMAIEILIDIIRNSKSTSRGSSRAYLGVDKDDNGSERAEFLQSQTCPATHATGARHMPAQLDSIYKKRC